MKQALLMASIFSFFSGLFGGSPEPSDYKPEAMFSELRKMVFSTKPDSIGVKIQGPNQVWGILMETGYPKAVVSLISLADGTVSLYFSNGGGIIGLGPHEGPKHAAQAFLSASQQFISQTTPTKSFPLPIKSYTRFYLLTASRVLTVEVLEQDLGQGHHPLSPLFYKGQDLITAVREVDEQLRAKQASPSPSPH